MNIAFVHFIGTTLALVFYGAWLLIGSLALWNGLVRPRSVGLIVLGTLMLGAWAVTVGAVMSGACWLQELDLNPEVERADVRGAWSANGSTLVLRDDSTFALRAEEDVAARLFLRNARGRWVWKPAQRHIELTPAGKTYQVSLMVVAKDSSLRLILPLDDPDTYDGWRGFERVDEASRETPP